MSPGVQRSRMHLSCGFPAYGLGCYKKCECTEDMCDFIHGCKYVSEAGSFIVKCLEPHS